MDTIEKNTAISEFWGRSYFERLFCMSVQYVSVAQLAEAQRLGFTAIFTHLYARREFESRQLSSIHSAFFENLLLNKKIIDV